MPRAGVEHRRSAAAGGGAGDVRSVLLSFAVLVALHSSARASAQNYRLGRYFPARADEVERLDGGSVIPPVIRDPAHAPDTIVPVLVIHNLAAPAHALEDDERLVGATTSDAS